MLEGTTLEATPESREVELERPCDKESDESVVHDPIAAPGRKEAGTRGKRKRRYAAAEGVECPECGKLRVFRSRRKNLMEKLRSRLFGRYPFRCHACGFRFLMKYKQPEENA